MDDIKTEEAVPQKRSGFARFMRRLLMYAILLGVLYIGIMYLLSSVFVYSKGDRIGYIYKFSNKGYIFKTYEGVLKTGFVNIGNTSTPNEEWAFSVADDSTANKITSIDQRIAVKLYYREYYTRLFFRGDTKYFVYKMEEMPQR